MRSIDIILPIYNAYDDLQNCVMSLKKYTNFSVHHLWLLDDCSPDERIIPYLKTLEGGNIHVICNKQNVGFSANINIGLQQSERDVLLLNSDTIVTKNWLEKIIECAYANPLIATVTPLTNNGTICAVPNVCQENTIPENLTLDEMADLVEKSSMKCYPEIPTAVGFCMYIKRKVIDEIGNLDDKIFERGYGEENDFCYRAVEKGYFNVICDDTFVYHKGTASFTDEEKKAYIQSHINYLMEHYKPQAMKSDSYVLVNENKDLYTNIKLHLVLREPQKGILLCYEERFFEDNRERVESLIDSIRLQGITLWFLCYKDGYYLLKGGKEPYDFCLNIDNYIKRTGTFKGQEDLYGILQCECFRIISSPEMAKKISLLAQTGLPLEILDDKFGNRVYEPYVKSEEELNNLWNYHIYTNQRIENYDLAVRLKKNRKMASDNWEKLQKCKEKLASLEKSTN